MKRVLTGAAVLSLAIAIAVGLNIWNAAGEVSASHQPKAPADNSVPRA